LFTIEFLDGSELNFYPDPLTFLAKLSLRFTYKQVNSFPKSILVMQMNYLLVLFLQLSNDCFDAYYLTFLKYRYNCFTNFLPYL